MWNYLLCKSGILLLLGEMGPYPHETSLSNESVCVLADCHAETETQKVRRAGGRGSCP